MGLILDRMQLCTALGVSDSSITAWEKDGMPIVQAGRGRGKKSFYDFEKVHAWCARTGRGSRIDVLMRAKPAASPEAAPRLDVCTGLTAAILSAAAKWLQAMHAAGFCEPDFKLVDLRDLAEAFVGELAGALEQLLGPDLARELRSAVDPDRAHSTVLDQAHEQLKPQTEFLEASGNGQG